MLHVGKYDFAKTLRMCAYLLPCRILASQQCGNKMTSLMIMSLAGNHTTSSNSYTKTITYTKVSLQVVPITA